MKKPQPQQQGPFAVIGGQQTSHRRFCGASSRRPASSPDRPSPCASRSGSTCPGPWPVAGRSETPGTRVDKTRPRKRRRGSSRCRNKTPPASHIGQSATPRRSRLWRRPGDNPLARIPPPNCAAGRGCIRRHGGDAGQYAAYAQSGDDPHPYHLLRVCGHASQRHAHADHDHTNRIIARLPMTSVNGAINAAPRVMPTKPALKMMPRV